MKEYDFREECCEDNRIHEDKVYTVKERMPCADVLYDVAELYKVFGDSTRVMILTALSTCELCVCDIASVLGMTKSAVSHQLRILRTAKLVKMRKHGKEAIYSLDDDHVRDILALALSHINE